MFHLFPINLQQVCRKVNISKQPGINLLEQPKSDIVAPSKSTFKYLHMNIMSSYQREHSETIRMVKRFLAEISSAELMVLKRSVEEYLAFRRSVDNLLFQYFSKICNQQCYENKLSACCSREGIIAFFADVAINVLVSRKSDVEALLQVLQRPNTGFKCIYLGGNGCLWRLKPIVCEMFICEKTKERVFVKNPEVGDRWRELKQREKRFTWPDRPVLFDWLESYFIEAGYESPLMYMHNSPGLLRVKREGKK